jgi:ferredoxin-type protein NapH
MKKLSVLWKRYSYILLLLFVIVGLVDFRLAIVAAICMVGPIVLALLKGNRGWCGNFCPRGNFYDNIVSKFSNNKKTPSFLKGKPFRMLITMFMLMFFSISIMRNRGDLYCIGMIFYRMIVMTTLLGIVLSLFYNSRIWCNFCPMGSIAAFISYFKKDKSLLQVQSSCVSCKLCNKKCPMDIEIHNYKGQALDNPDCIQCGKCITVCPKKSINY